MTFKVSSLRKNSSRSSDVSCPRLNVGDGGAQRGAPRRDGRETKIRQFPLLRQFQIAVPTRIKLDLSCITTEDLQWMDALMGAMVLAYPKSFPRLLEGRLRNKHDRAAVASVASLLRGVCGPGAAKRFSCELRQISVAKTPTSTLRGTLSLNGMTDSRKRAIVFQLSRFGRAGPYPGRVKVDESLRQHRADLIASPAVPRFRLKYLRRFASRWAHGRSSVGKVGFSRSAGFADARSTGGWGKAVALNTERVRAIPMTQITLSDFLGFVGEPLLPFQVRGQHPSVDQDGPRATAPFPLETCILPWKKEYAESLSFTLETWEVQREYLLSFLCAVYSLWMEGYIDGGTRLQARRVVVSERGDKARVVTPITSLAAFVGTFINSLFLSLLKDDPRVSPVDTWSQPEFRVADHDIVRSADLSRASDLIPASISRSISLGLVEGLGFRGTVVEGLVRMFCRPVDILDPGVAQWSTLGQPLMGSGPTWPVLSVWNLAVSWSAGMRQVRIRGDDLLAVCTPFVSDRYDKFLNADGGLVSLGKDTRSRYAGCFLEQLCVVEFCVPPYKRGRYALSWKDSFSVGSQGSLQRVKPRGEEAILPSWMKGPSLGVCPGSDFIQKLVYENARTMLKRSGLDPYLPRVLGGPGFPGSPAQIRHAISTLRPQWARAVRVVMAQGPLAAPYLLRLAAPWSLAGDSVPKMLADWVMDELRSEEISTNQSTSDRGALERKGTMTLERFALEVVAPMAEVFRQQDLTFAEKPFSFPTILDVKSRLDKIIREIDDLIPYPRLTDKTRNLTKGIEKFVADLNEGLVLFRVPTKFRVSYGFGTASVVSCSQEAPAWHGR